MTNEKRIAIVTGASRGIGAALAHRLAMDGFCTIINYQSDADAAKRVVARIEEAGGMAMAVQADVSKPHGIRHLFDVAEHEYGLVDVLVNNAGILKVAPIASVSDEDFNAQMKINVFGAFYGLREGANRVRDGGRIISLSTSIVGTYMPAHGVYAATKAAVETMTRVLAKEVGNRQITVNAVSPGPVGTDLFLTGRSEEIIQRITADIPMGRLGEPDDIARIISFLAGPESSWISGQVIRANGGRN